MPTACSIHTSMHTRADTHTHTHTLHIPCHCVADVCWGLPRHQHPHQRSGVASSAVQQQQVVVPWCCWLRWWCSSPATAYSTDPAEDLHQLRQVVLDSGSIIHACLGKQEGPVQARRETRERKAYVNMHVPPFSFQIE